MDFIDKIKNILGIGGIKLDVPVQLACSYASGVNELLKQIGTALGKDMGVLGKMLQQKKSTFFLTA
jgi:hypothetical protein